MQIFAVRSGAWNCKSVYNSRLVLSRIASRIQSGMLLVPWCTANATPYFFVSREESHWVDPHHIRRRWWGGTLPGNGECSHFEPETNGRGRLILSEMDERGSTGPSGPYTRTGWCTWHQSSLQRTGIWRPIFDWVRLCWEGGCHSFGKKVDHKGVSKLPHAISWSYSSMCKCSRLVCCYRL